MAESALVAPVQGQPVTEELGLRAKKRLQQGSSEVSLVALLYLCWRRIEDETTRTASARGVSSWCGTNGGDAMKRLLRQ